MPIVEIPKKPWRFGPSLMMFLQVRSQSSRSWICTLKTGSGGWSLKTISKSSPPNELMTFADDDPAEKSRDFRNEKSGEDYKALRATILKDQGGFFAFCEQAITLRLESSRRVEHVHSKSDASQPGVSWALDWNKVVAVCLGGSPLHAGSTKAGHVFLPLGERYSESLRRTIWCRLGLVVETGSGNFRASAI